MFSQHNGIPLQGEFSTRQIRVFTLRAGTQLAKDQEAYENGMRRESTNEENEEESRREEQQEQEENGEEMMKEMMKTLEQKKKEQNSQRELKRVVSRAAPVVF
jgi:hypothetical protein